jgi:hypothetical protein
MAWHGHGHGISMGMNEHDLSCFGPEIIRAVCIRFVEYENCQKRRTQFTTSTVIVHVRSERPL